MAKKRKVNSIKKGAQDITWREVSKLVPYARNSRIHSDSQISQIAESIKEFGFTNPVLLNGENGILAGHGRLLAAELLEMAEVPTIDLGYMTKKQQQSYVLADNQHALNAGWDPDLLASELQEITEFNFDLGALGFTMGELSLINLRREDGTIDPRAAWTGMPEFNQPSALSFRQVIVHFDSHEDAAEFFKKIEQDHTDKTRSIWYPYKERRDIESENYVKE